ncbi:MAG: hypothetical protein AAF228_03280 [Pseudomonadota bacterium]
MTDIENNAYMNETEATPHGLTPKQMRILKSMVFISGILLLTGFLSLASVIIYKLLGTNQTTNPQSLSHDLRSQSQKSTTELKIPKDAKLGPFQIQNKTFAFSYQNQQQTKYVIIDIETGEIKRRIVVNSK